MTKARNLPAIRRILRADDRCPHVLFASIGVPDQEIEHLQFQELQKVSPGTAGTRVVAMQLDSDTVSRMRDN